MKNLVQFIKEELKSKVVENVKVVFDVLPEQFYLTAPEGYSESDIQIYLGDIIMTELPSENDKYANLLGKNANNISDAYFEYDKFEHINDYNADVNLEWDSHYDEKVKDEDLNTFKLTKLKYIILFDEFELKDSDFDGNIKELLNQIFNKFDSSSINKYPAEIKYNPDLLEFDE